MSNIPRPAQHPLVTSHEAIDLLDYRRFDIPAKTLYARFLEANLDTDWGIRVYEHHLQVWNGLRESNPEKNGLNAYLTTYREIMAAVKGDVFEFDRSPVYLNASHAVINGSHRLAAAIFFNKAVKARVVADDFGQICPYPYLRDKKDILSTGLQEEYADAMAGEYIRLKADRAKLFIVILFPVAQGRDETVSRILEEHSRPVYQKAVHLTSNGAVNLIRQVYLHEPWLGAINNGFPGSIDKANRCFAKIGPVHVHLVESTHLDEINLAKKRIRDLFDVGNHSVHINNSNKEARFLANIFFNRNTLHFLNFATSTPLFHTFNHLFTTFKQWTNAEGINTEDVCVDASSTLSAYGLREARDLDFLHARKLSPTNNPTNVNSHNSSAHHYQQTIDDIIYNPTNHFYYDGIKFTTLDVVKAMKVNRGEEKDARDVQLIEQLQSGAITPRVRVKTGSRWERLLRRMRRPFRTLGHQ